MIRPIVHFHTTTKQDLKENKMKFAIKPASHRTYVPLGEFTHPVNYLKSTTRTISNCQHEKCNETSEKMTDENPMSALIVKSYQIVPEKSILVDISKNGEILFPGEAKSQEVAIGFESSSRGDCPDSGFFHDVENSRYEFDDESFISESGDVGGTFVFVSEDEMLSEPNVLNSAVDLKMPEYESFSKKFAAKVFPSVKGNSKSTVSNFNSGESANGIKNNQILSQIHGMLSKSPESSSSKENKCPSAISETESLFKEILALHEEMKQIDIKRLTDCATAEFLLENDEYLQKNPVLGLDSPISPKATGLCCLPKMKIRASLFPSEKEGSLVNQSPHNLDTVDASKLERNLEESNSTAIAENSNSSDEMSIGGNFKNLSEFDSEVRSDSIYSSEDDIISLQSSISDLGEFSDFPQFSNNFDNEFFIDDDFENDTPLCTSFEYPTFGHYEVDGSSFKLDDLPFSEKFQSNWNPDGGYDSDVLITQKDFEECHWNSDSIPRDSDSSGTEDLHPMTDDGKFTEGYDEVDGNRFEEEVIELRIGTGHSATVEIQSFVDGYHQINSMDTNLVTGRQESSSKVVYCSKLIHNVAVDFDA